jgi:predicted TPR repeat methyltransferase
MLQKAEARHVYDALYKFELTAYLEDNPGEFDAIVSADTLVYFGPLERVAAAAAGGLRAGGLLVFTVEELIGGEAGVGYALRAHGRYCHSEQYVEDVLRGADLRPEFERATLRLEAGEPVAGLVVRARKPSGQG